MVDNMVFIPIPTIADELLGHIKPPPLPENVQQVIRMTKPSEEHEDRIFRTRRRKRGR